MNARTETIATIGGTRTIRRAEEVELHPARGIIAAIGLSLVLWSAGIALILAG